MTPECRSNLGTGSIAAEELAKEPDQVKGSELTAGNQGTTVPEAVGEDPQKNLP